MRWSASALILECTLLWVDALAGGGLVAGLPAVVLSAALAWWTGATSALGTAIGACVAGSTLMAVADQLAESSRFSFASDGLFYLVMLLAPALIAWAIAGRARQIVVLTARRRDLEVRRASTVRNAVAQENERVSRRVDEVLAVRVRALRDDAARLAEAAPDAAERLAAIESNARLALAELREVLGTLRTAATPDLTTPRTRPVGDSPSRSSRGVDALLVAALIPLAIETALPGRRGAAVMNVLFALAQSGALVALRRRPVPGSVLLITLAVAQTAVLTPLPRTVSWLLPGLLAAFLAGLLARRRGAVTALVIMLAGVALMEVVAPAGHHSYAGLAPILVLGLLAWTAGRFAAGRERRTRELSAITDELDRTVGVEVELAASEQRALIARELHDVGAHALTVVCLQAGAAQMWWERDRARAQPAIASLLDVAGGPLTQIAATLDVLTRVNEVETIDVDTLDVLAGLGRALGLRVEVRVAGMPDRVQADSARVAYRVVQEALTNAARHAGQTDVTISLVRVDGMIEIRIQDAGPLADRGGPAVAVPGSGLGLQGMRERVHAIHGELIAGPIGSGFHVFVRLPA